MPVLTIHTMNDLQRQYDVNVDIWNPKDDSHPTYFDSLMGYGRIRYSLGHGGVFNTSVVNFIDDILGLLSRKSSLYLGRSTLDINLDQGRFEDIEPRIIEGFRRLFAPRELAVVRQ